MPQECVGRCLFNSPLGLDLSKASGGPVACQTVLLPVFLYSSGTVIIPERDFSGCPKSISSVCFSFNFLGFSRPFWHVVSGSLAAEPAAG